LEKIKIKIKQYKYKLKGINTKKSVAYGLPADSSCKERMSSSISIIQKKRYIIFSSNPQFLITSKQNSFVSFKKSKNSLVCQNHSPVWTKTRRIINQETNPWHATQLTATKFHLRPREVNKIEIRTKYYTVYL